MGDVDIIAEDARKALDELLIRVRDGLKPTLLMGILPNNDLMDEKGGMDFRQLFRFEKWHFTLYGALGVATSYGESTQGTPSIFWDELDFLRV